MSEKTGAEKELLRLRRENKYLRQRLFAMGGGRSLPSYARKFAGRLRASEKTSYAGYIGGKLSASGIITAYRRIYGAVRKFLFASSLLRVLTFIVALVNSSAALLLIFSALAVLLPAFAVLSLLGALTALLTRKKCEKRLLKTLSGRVYVVFGQARGKFRKELMERGTLLCVRESVSSCGFSSANIRPDGSVDIHISFIFSLMKKLEKDGRISIIKIF